jgi:hypothetical protein
LAEEIKPFFALDARFLAVEEGKGKDLEKRIFAKNRVASRKRRGYIVHRQGRDAFEIFEKPF